MSHSISRREEIVSLLTQRGNLSIDELAKRFDVSTMTIRRDLHKLKAAGKIIRTPGGATLGRTVTFERNFAERLRRMSEAKSKIGRVAASLVGKGESIVLDSGTTTLSLAHQLRTRSDIVVITFSLAVLDDLTACRVELTGGQYRRSSMDLVGQAVREALARVHANKVFFGAAALSFKKGVMVNDQDFPMDLLNSAAERILLVDSSKIGREALYHLCPTESCDLVITDKDVDPGALRKLKRSTKVIVAD
jgi:DeoR family transcriptional regulator, aga operon transcriptional repressor